MQTKNGLKCPKSAVQGTTRGAEKPKHRENVEDFNYSS